MLKKLGEGMCCRPLAVVGMCALSLATSCGKGESDFLSNHNVCKVSAQTETDAAKQALGTPLTALPLVDLSGSNPAYAQKLTASETERIVSGAVIFLKSATTLSDSVLVEIWKGDTSSTPYKDEAVAVGKVSPGATIATSSGAWVYVGFEGTATLESGKTYWLTVKPVYGLAPTGVFQVGIQTGNGLFHFNDTSQDWETVTSMSLPNRIVECK